MWRMHPLKAGGSRPSQAKGEGPRLPPGAVFAAKCCALGGCGAAPFSDAELARALPADSFATYARCVLAYKEAKAMEAVRQEHE